MLPDGGGVGGIYLRDDEKGIVSHWGFEKHIGGGAAVGYAVVMRATLDISDDVWERARALAERAGVPVDHLAEEGLRREVRRRAVLDDTQQDGNGERSDAEVAQMIAPGVVLGRGLCDGLPADFMENIRDWAYEEEPV